MVIEDEYFCGGNPRPHIADGIYEAECFDCERGFYRTFPKLYIKFRLLNRRNREGDNVELFMVCSMSHDGYIPVGSKYYLEWSKANGRLPSRGAKMSPRVFLNQRYKVKVRTVKPVDGRVPISEDFRYSVVDSIIEVLD